MNYQLVYKPTCLYTRRRNYWSASYCNGCINYKYILVWTGCIIVNW